MEAIKKKEMLNDIIVWDVENWSKAIRYWEQVLPVRDKQYQCLELGSSKGGMSLWLALNGNSVLCTDLNGPERDAYFIHEKYNCRSKIQYAAVDALDIPFKNKFDIIIFKSIIGGISSNSEENKAKVIEQIHKALKPGGQLLFAENLEATYMHKVLRRNFGTKGWNYLRFNEIKPAFSAFKKVTYKTVGFFGCLGRNEWQRNMLGKIDGFLNGLIPDRFKYIVIGVA